MRLLLLILCVAGTWAAVPCPAQDYQLVEPSGVITADVYMRHGQMVVNDADGRQYLFQRDRSFDSFDGRYAGYWLPPVNRVVRFPRSGLGLLQVADLDHVLPRYVFSRRSVRPVGRRPGRPPRHHHRHGWAFIPPYFVSPYGYPAFGYGWHSFGTTLSVGPWGWGPAFGPRRYAQPLMQSIVVDSQIVPRQPLPPVTANLMNSAQREVRVTVTDRVAPDQSKRIRIAPGASELLVVHRDAGADLVRHVLTYAPDGSQITRQVSTSIGPSPRYELTVHEWRLQSVAIDRTGKSPNVIEDSHFQGRGLGRFEIPPGDQFTGGTLDVVRIALQAGNQGTVAPLLDDQGVTPLRPVSSLEQMLLEQRRASGQK
ncbi:hypothetical protein Mal15_57920 [Stieleria maiorica]|uniref:Uncharacterized protein n=1 Tax=Stieleria maiorica TaxID=2795974 RepID=A0A5B9ML90_9BACT|nr:hypothetical protein [Stieleria maiorica]QEG01714.1 hypothetical protein Mal15_57920 [Stieleria maiorica]